MSLARTFKALSEEPRLQILALLREQELSGAEIVSILRMNQSRVSRHLGVLREAGLVEARRDGGWVFFRAAGAAAGPEATAALEAVSGLLDRTLDARIRARLQAAVLRRQESVRRFFDEKASEWDRMRGQTSDELSALRTLAPLLPQGLRVADLGTGTGAMLPHLARHAAEVLAVDSSAAMLAAARVRLLEAGVAGVRLLRADLEALPLASGCLDGALCHMVLHYAQDPGQAVEEMARVVRRGGTLSVVDLQTHEHEELRESLAHQRLGFSREEIHDWLEKSGAELLAYEAGTVQLGELTFQSFHATARKVASHESRVASQATSPPGSRPAARDEGPAASADDDDGSRSGIRMKTEQPQRTRGSRLATRDWRR